MLDKQMSRRKFLVGAGALAAAAGVGGVGLLTHSEDAQAAPVPAPWPYPTDAASQPDPKALAKRAYELYFTQGGCAEATWWPVIEYLSAQADPKYAPWAGLPAKMFGYGGGGCGGWGTLCGTCNGSSAIIGMTIPAASRTKFIDEIMQYYAETPLPTNGVDKAVRDDLWTPSGAGVQAPLVNVPTSTAHSQLCHASLAQWTMTTGKADGSADQRDRCAKACFDMTLKTVKLLNDYWLNNAATVPAGALDSTVAGCGVVTNGCHQSAKGKMACDSCHDDKTPTHASK